jgi:hypothetical protein
LICHELHNVFRLGAREVRAKLVEFKTCLCVQQIQAKYERIIGNHKAILSRMETNCKSQTIVANPLSNKAFVRNRKLRLWDPTLGPNLGTKFGTQPWDPTMGPHHGNPPWDPTMGPNHGTQPWDPAMGPNLGTQPRDPTLRPNLGTQTWDQPWDPTLSLPFQ